MQVGRGVAVSAITTQFGSGSFETTSSATDVAIDGDGFFMVNDNYGATYYTRAGNFHMNSDGYLVDANGYILQGHNLTTTTSANIENISLRSVQSEPQITTEFSVGINLDAEESEGGTFSSSQTVYDSLGALHTLNIVFTKTAVNGVWDITVSLDGTAASAQSATSLTFDGSGVLTDPAADISVTFADPLPNGATIGTAGVVNWDLVGETALTITGYSSPSAIKSLSNDGYASGDLKSLSISSDGIISGFFTNGQTADIAQIVLAKFNDPNGLKKMGNNLFGETVNSGPAIKNSPGTAGMGEVKANSLEMSNVDVATEFINMITAQKAYTASARVITTEDSMMTELMNIRR
jgi:flagellar hook protein FlgE